MQRVLRNAGTIAAGNRIARSTMILGLAGSPDVVATLARRVAGEVARHHEEERLLLQEIRPAENVLAHGVALVEANGARPAEMDSNEHAGKRVLDRRVRQAIKGARGRRRGTGAGERVFIAHERGNDHGGGTTGGGMS